jgi:hypothetical protein
MFSTSTAAMLPLLLLLLLGDTLAVAPGDEYDGCEVPDYPRNIKVLIDSWRYQTLLAGNDATNTNTTVWTADSTGGKDTWYSGGVCGDSTVAVCSGEPGEKWLKTQYINKSLPAPDEYPVRVFVNITYTLTCPGMGSGVGPRMMMMCEREFELLIAHSKTGDYTGDNIMPTNRIEHSQDTINSITKQFYFDVSEEEDGFFLALKRSHKDVCINVSRVLVYRHECPGHEKLSVGLIRYPATQAPVNGTVSAMPYCAENSNHSKGSIPDRLVCTAEGEWMNDGTECECDMGYSRKGDKCEASTTPSDPLTDSSEIQIPVSTASSTPSDPVTSSSGVTQTAVFTASTTPTGNSVTVTVAPTTPSDTLAGGTTTSVSQTSTLTPNTPTATPTDTSDAEDDGVPSAVFAVVGVMMAVIIALILIVILLMIFLVRKNRKQQDGSHVANPVYDIASQSTKTELNSSTMPNECGYVHKQDEDTSRVFHNTLYSTTPPKTTEGKSNNGETQSNGYYEEPQYSVPSDVLQTTQYETPVITSPSGAEGPTQPPPVYDYAATVPQTMAPEYAVLEPQAHMYHFLESPDPHTATPAGHTATPAGHTATPAGDSEKTETGTEEQEAVVSNLYEDPETLNQNHEYSAVEQN